MCEFASFTCKRRNHLLTICGRRLAATKTDSIQLVAITHVISVEDVLVAVNSWLRMMSNPVKDLCVSILFVFRLERRMYMNYEHGSNFAVHHASIANCEPPSANDTHSMLRLHHVYAPCSRLLVVLLRNGWVCLLCCGVGGKSQTELRVDLKILIELHVAGDVVPNANTVRVIWHEPGVKMVGTLLATCFFLFKSLCFGQLLLFYL